jgi:hypothetical protein
MEDLYRESIWWKNGRPREMYPDMSCKDAPVPPEGPFPNCDCGHPAHMGQSRHPDTPREGHRAGWPLSRGRARAARPPRPLREGVLPPCRRRPQPPRPRTSASTRSGQGARAGRGRGCGRDAARAGSNRKRREGAAVLVGRVHPTMMRGGAL